MEALAVIDEHPVLSLLSDFRTDEYWARGAEADAIEFDRAIEFLEMFTETEIADRLEAVRATRGWPGDEIGPQECPACGK